MQLVEDHGNAQYKIHAYDRDWVLINDQKIFNSVVISPNDLINPWQPRSVEQLKPDHFHPILRLNPSVFVLGTGVDFILLAPEYLIPFYQRNIGVEVMDSASACRTYTLLMCEARNVAAAILIDSP
jgi:uncharacterized protein